MSRIIDVVATDYRECPEIAPLNPMLRPGASLLKMTVRVDWHPEDAAASLAALERQLAAAVPGLSRHQCRGPHQYHILAGAGGEHDGPAAPTEFDPRLALAHLVEHVMIDAVAFVTGAQRISGVTGALAGETVTFDVFVECPSRSVALLASHLGRTWVEMLLGGQHLNGEPKLTLTLARRLYEQAPAAVDSVSAARGLGKPVHEVEESLDQLAAAGFAGEEVAALNLSGVRQFRHTGARN